MLVGMERICGQRSQLQVPSTKYREIIDILAGMWYNLANLLQSLHLQSILMGGQNVFEKEEMAYCVSSNGYRIGVSDWHPLDHQQAIQNGSRIRHCMGWGGYAFLLRNSFGRLRSGYWCIGLSILLKRITGKTFVPEYYHLLRSFLWKEVDELIWWNHLIMQVLASITRKAIRVFMKNADLTSCIL